MYPSIFSLRATQKMGENISLVNVIITTYFKATSVNRRAGSNNIPTYIYRNFYNPASTASGRKKRAPSSACPRPPAPSLKGLGILHRLALVNFYVARAFLKPLKRKLFQCFSPPPLIIIFSYSPRISQLQPTTHQRICRVFSVRP